MPTIDTTCSTVRTLPSRPTATVIVPQASRCGRSQVSAPRRRSRRPFTAGQLACEDYARAVFEARVTGAWM